MRRIAAAITATALAGALAACGGTTVKTTPDKTAAPTTPRQAPATTTAATPTATKASTAHIGDTLTLHGTDSDTNLSVTIVKWVDPAKSSDEFTSPDKGNRWVAAQFRLVNHGTKPYSDSPTNGAKVADSQGQRFGTVVADISAGPAMDSGLDLPPGETALGWVVFEVPTASKVVTVQWAADSGFSDEVGQWAVK